MLTACPLSLPLVWYRSLVASAPGFPQEGGEGLGLVPQLLYIDVAPMEPCCFMLTENLAFGTR